MHHPFRIGSRQPASSGPDPAPNVGTQAPSNAALVQTPSAGAAALALGGARRGPVASASAPRSAVLPQPTGWQAAPVRTSSRPPNLETTAALRTTRAAESKLPELMDRQAEDGRTAKTAQGVVDTLQHQWDRALPAAQQALNDRRAALDTARTDRQDAQAEHTAAQTEHTRIDVAHRQAVTNRPAMAHALQLAEQALDRAQAPGPGPAPNVQDLRTARDQAQQALQRLDTDIARHVAAQPAARDRLTRAEAQLTSKTTACVAAEQAVQRLEHALTEAQRIVPAQMPAVQAYANAAGNVVQAAGDARREQTTLADLSLSVAHRTRVAQDAGQQDQVVRQLQDERQVMAARAQPGGDLRQRHDAASAEVGRQQTALGQAEQQIRQLEGDIRQQRAQLDQLKTRTSVLRALGRGRDHPVRQDRRDAVVERRTTRQQMAVNERQLTQTQREASQARQSLAGANRALAQENAALAAHQQALNACDVRIAEQRPQQQALHDELGRLDAWANTGGATRDGQQTVALDAQAQAQAVRDTADRAVAPAHAATQRIETAMTSLFTELAPSGPAAKEPDAPRSALQRAADGMRGLYQGYLNRTTPPKVELTIGPITHTSASAGPTTFNGGHAPGRQVTEAALSQRGQKAIDAKTATSGAAAAAQLAGKPGLHLFDRGERQAATPQALRSATAFTQEVAQLFQAPSADAATLVGLAPTVFANRLLDHPNPDPVGRHEGHPLRHEEALLIASALSAVTSDPAVAANVYNQLWNDRPALPGAAARDPAVASPMAGMATEPRGNAVSADPDVMRMAHATRRVLAGSPAGMDALMHMQGLSLPPAGDPGRADAARVLEQYKFSLRAETALLGRLNVGGAQTTQDVLAAVDHAAPARQLLDPSILGIGKARREDPATLASQALKYAAANMARGAGQAEQHPEFKAAYVALRNGFSESGQGSDFNAMAKRLHKFVHYIDVAVADKPNISTVLGRLGRLAQRVGGKEMSPLTTLLQAGPLGSDLGQVPAEYKKQLGQAVAGSATQLQNHLTASMATSTPEARTRDLTRLAALQLWNEQLGVTTDPYAKIRLGEADVMQRARDLAGQLNAPQPALNDALARQECARHLSEPMQPSVLSTWLGRGSAASRLPANNADIGKLRDAFAMLEGKGQFVNTLSDLQREFDGGDAATRRNVLRKLLVSVVTGGDVADYSDGRKNAISGRIGFSPAGVSVNGLTVGITPVVEGSYDHTKSAVLRAGVASNSGVLYLGQDTRQGASIGVGVRAGITEGLGDYSVGAIARLGGIHGSSSGLMIRTNKAGTEHATLPPDTRQPPPAGWKRMTEMAVDTVFDLAGAGAAKPANANQMWQGMVDQLGDYHDISFGYNRGSANTASWSLQADGIAAVRLGPDDKKTLLGTQVGVGLKHTFFNHGKARDTAGSMQAFQGSSAQRVSGAATADVGVTHPVIKTHDGGSVSLLSRSKIGVESEMIFGASSGLIRLSTEDGRINPNISFKQREVAVEGDFFKLVNAQRSEWTHRLGERGADGRMHGGDAALDQFMAQLANLPPGRNRLFIERKNLKPEAAETINALTARLDVLQRGVDERAAQSRPPAASVKQEIEALQARIANEVNAEANWQPFRLFVNETNQMAQDTQLGLEGRYAPPARSDPMSAPDSAAEAIRHGGGKLVLGGVVRAAKAGRDLLTLDAQPEQA